MMALVLLDMENEIIQEMKLVPENCRMVYYFMQSFEAKLDKYFDITDKKMVAMYKRQVNYRPGDELKVAQVNTDGMERVVTQDTVYLVRKKWPLETDESEDGLKKEGQEDTNYDNEKSVTESETGVTKPLQPADDDKGKTVTNAAEPKKDECMIQGVTNTMPQKGDDNNETNGVTESETGVTKPLQQTGDDKEQNKENQGVTQTEQGIKEGVTIDAEEKTENPVPPKGEDKIENNKGVTDNKGEDNTDKTENPVPPTGENRKSRVTKR